MEKAFVALIVIGLLMKLFNALASPILFIGFAGLFLLYLVLGSLLFNGIPLRRVFRADSYRGIPGWSFLLAFISGVCQSVALGGMFFSIVGYPGRVFLLLSGLLLCLLTDIIFFFTVRRTPLFHRLSPRLLAVIAAGALIFTLTL
jgi:hypothetical protein